MLSRSIHRVTRKFPLNSQRGFTITTETITNPAQVVTLCENPEGPKLGALHSFKVFLEKDKPVYWCSCGLSKNQPFCDGSHKGTKFSPVKFVPEESKIYGLCLCKYTNKVAVCDGMHKKFAGYVPPVKPTTTTPAPEQK